MSRYSIVWKKHTLIFRFRAGTSRGFMHSKDTWFIIIHDLEEGKFGIGEAGPLKGLSIDDRPDFEYELSRFTKMFERSLNLGRKDIQVNDISNDLPSIKMGFETSWLDLQNGSSRIIFDNAFTSENKRIPINGLIWMGDSNFMNHQINEKLNDGFDCIKMKIGAIDFDSELEILKGIRRNHSPDQVLIRVDANGAFSPENALERLDALKNIGIHSIEQPIRAGQIEHMKKLCQASPIPIGLDEELIGIHGKQNKKSLLKEIQPQFIILKPSLLGGFSETLEWINMADSMNIDWWITSALESNIGLNAICQFTAEFDSPLHHGLGTGQLYQNNINSPLMVEKGSIYYRQEFDWDLSYVLGK